MKRRKYSKEFKLEALRLFEQHGNTRANLARELGIERSLLYKWRRELKDLGEADAFVGRAGRSGNGIEAPIRRCDRKPLIPTSLKAAGSRPRTGFHIIEFKPLERSPSIAPGMPTPKTLEPSPDKRIHSRYTHVRSFTQMLERELRRYAAYFRGWCQAFGEHESIYREEEIGIHWLAAESQVGLVLPKPLIKAIYREVLLHEQAPTLTFNDEGVQIGSLEIGLEKKFRKKALPAIERILESGNDVHVFLTSHLLYEGSRIITFSNKSPLSIIYKEIGTMNVRLEQNEPVALEQ